MANWHYYNESKEKIGPITGTELKQLVRQGTITPETFVEDPTGRTGLAKDVNGLKFPKTTSPEPTLSVESDPFTTPAPFDPTAQTTPTPPSAANLFCTNCGNSVAEQAVACMSCGARPTGHKKFCRHCGVGLNPEQVVCVKCGSALNTAGGFQSLGDGMKPVSDFLSTHNMTAGEIAVFAATALAFISFILPWTEATVPMMGKVTSSGFSLYAFLLGILFIHPVWMALKKKRTLHYKVRGYIWGGIGIIAGIAFPLIVIEVNLARVGSELGDQLVQQVARELISAGAGSYVFVGACIVLIVGIALQPRPSSDTKTVKDVCYDWRLIGGILLLFFGIPATFGTFVGTFGILGLIGLTFLPLLVCFLLSPEGERVHFWSKKAS